MHVLVQVHVHVEMYRWLWGIHLLSANIVAEKFARFSTTLLIPRHTRAMKGALGLRRTR
ncbi:MAG: hypothetical protein KDH09_12340 [Chrysiogenetes bacterium]|nr:hypothetical protein [Chrysiogenetes bacterium]